MNTATEISILVSRLNELQKKAYNSTKYEIDHTIRPEWSKIITEVKTSGYVLKKRRISELGEDGFIYRIVRWDAVLPSANTRNNECEFIYTDNRPKNRPTLKGDCTTRALTYALGGDYTTIENRQYAIAAERGGLRNQSTNWGIVAEENGFVRIWWVGSVKRSVLGGMVRKNGNVNRPLITVSSGHCAVVDTDGSVRDIWDSRGGRVKYLYCHKSDTNTILAMLNRVCPKVSNPSI